MSAEFLVEPARRIAGTLRVPGDKSISHRAVMFGALAEGHTRVTGFLPGEDCLATLAAVQAMGIRVHRPDATTVELEGRGMGGLSAPPGPLDMGNSGTAMRLFTGLLCAQSFDSVLVGDESLTRRPMERVAVPLRLMGATVESTDGHPPLRIRGGRRLRGIHYDMPVASAQVKSAILLAGLYAEGTTSVSEPAPTRDHTERMLSAFGCPVTTRGNVVSVTGGSRLQGTAIDVPGDLSSAAFPILAACVAEEGELVLEHVGLNPTRTGILRILELMNADIRVEATDDGRGEPCGRIRVRPSRLKGAVIPPELVPLAIDEFPMVFVAAALAEGETVVSGAEELRHKESDRIRVMVDNLRALGVEVTETPDGARIHGGGLGGGTVESHGDHRVAMAFAAGAVAARGTVRIRDVANVATSFPGFPELMGTLGLRVRLEDGARG
jgi:3-phosphoshikimate 1-carboxyvinyltransferase